MSVKLKFIDSVYVRPHADVWENFNFFSRAALYGLSKMTSSACFVKGHKLELIFPPIKSQAQADSSEVDKRFSISRNHHKIFSSTDWLIYANKSTSSSFTLPLLQPLALDRFSIVFNAMKSIIMRMT